MTTEYPSQIELSDVSSVDAVVSLPGSKSITNRAYLIAALANGTSRLHNPLHSEDTEAMTDCLQQLGVDVDSTTSDLTTIRGTGGRLQKPVGPLCVKNSGTTIRFLAAAAALTPDGTTTVLDGIARMRQRPIGDLVEAIQQLGVHAETAGGSCPPISVSGGGVYGGTALIKGAISSQYLSAILMSSPYAKIDVTLLVDGELVSKPYVDMTTSMMRSFGVNVLSNKYASFQIPGGQSYAGQDYYVEPDASNASYFLAAAAITGGRVVVNGLGTSSIQGDVAFIDVLRTMGCKIEKNYNTLVVQGTQELKGIEFNASEIPDMAQTIAVVAAFATGATTLTGLRTLRVKETDRIHALALELSKIGATIIEGHDYLTISPIVSPISAAINTYNDHRMAMSFAVAGLRIANLKINNPSCVAKTFPDFWVRWGSAFPGSIKSQDHQ